ncbi:MAG TPA: NAD-dependent epimerase/dehydratase family protein [bacterium]|nr:NAD-dependent epimerase/dehydratase family protein [bacterium]
MAKILVTGGAGFIGSNLVDKLISLNHQVVVIDNLFSGKRDYLNSLAIFYQVDINDKEKVSEIFIQEKFDYVYHLAAQIDVRKSVEDMAFDNQVNILGALNILDNCYKNKVKKIIFASSGGAAYGFPEEVPTPENYPTNPVSPYGINKLCFEKYLNYYYKVFGQKYSVCRLANVYGPRQYKGGEAGVIAIFINNAVEKKLSYVYGDGLQTRDFVYVDDVVDAFVANLNEDIVGVFNIGTGVEKTLLDIILAIEKSIGDKIKIEFQEAKLGEERRSCLKTDLAREILNWKAQVDLEEGIKRTLNWSESQVSLN